MVWVLTNLKVAKVALCLRVCDIYSVATSLVLALLTKARQISCNAALLPLLLCVCGSEAERASLSHKRRTTGFSLVRKLISSLRSTYQVHL